MTDLEQRIRERAYSIWLEEGSPEGRADVHWDLATELVAIEILRKAPPWCPTLMQSARPGSQSSRCPPWKMQEIFRRLPIRAKNFFILAAEAQNQAPNSATAPREKMPSHLEYCRLHEVTRHRFVETTHEPVGTSSLI
jgi:hypothetical protein